MAKYRKKPVVVEATQWFENGDHPEDDVHGSSKLREGKVVRRFQCRPLTQGLQSCSKCGSSMNTHGWIDTLEGGHIVCPGDWIVTGIRNERYPCKPDIFEATYERAGVPVTGT